MVSVNKIKEKNELSKELKEHGLAANNTDAFDQADAIYEKTRESPDPEFKEGEQPKQEGKPVDAKIEKLKERIHCLERYKKFARKRENEYEEQINELISKMNEMVGSINMLEKENKELREKMKKLRSGNLPSNSQQENQPQQEQSSNSQTETPKQAGQKTSEEKITSPVDDTGVAPSEVAVEDIFYSGSN